MSYDPWDTLASVFGSELDTIRKTVTNELQSLGLGELEASVPGLYQLVRSMGGGDPLSTILETAGRVAFGNGQALIAQALENYFSPVTTPVQTWQSHKQNLAEALQMHWSAMDGRITQLYTTDQFRGDAANELIGQHDQLKQTGQRLHNQLLDSSLSDSQMLGSVNQAIQEKSSEIASLGPVGPMAVLMALQLAPSPVLPDTQSPPQWIQELEKDVEQWFQEVNPLDPEKPLIIRILLGIADTIAGIELVTLAAIIAALALLVFSIWLLWEEQQPSFWHSPRLGRNLSGPQPQPVPTPLASVDAAEVKRIAEILQKEGYKVDEGLIEELLAQRYTPNEIISLITLLGLIYGKNNVGAYLAQFIGYGHDYALKIAGIMNSLKKATGLVVDPDIVNKLLTTNMGNDTHFTEAEALQILLDFSSIYRYESDPTKGSQAVTNAVQTLLDQGFDKATTLKLADTFSHYFQVMQQKTIVNRYGHRVANPDYKATMAERLQAIDNAVNGLNFNKLNAQKYRLFNSSNHALHARDMSLTEEEYRQEAINFLKGAPLDDELQLTRSNGETIRWNMDTGEFGILQSNGNVKTYYNIGTGDDAWKYFLKQANSTGE